MPQSRHCEINAAVSVAVPRTIGPHLLAVKTRSKRRSILADHSSPVPVMAGPGIAVRSPASSYWQQHRERLHPRFRPVRYLLSASVFRVALSKGSTGSFTQSFARVAFRQSCV